MLNFRHASSKQIQLIGCGNGVGGRQLGCEYAAQIMRRSPLLKRCNIEHRWVTMIHEVPTGRQRAAIPGISKLAEQLAFAIQQRVLLNQHPVVIGGDHCCAIGTWSGLAGTLRHSGNIGLIWFDAHLDAHTPETSETGNVHGMPVAHLLGYGDKLLTSIFDDQPKIRPSNLVYIASRSYESAEKKLIGKIGAKIFSQHDVDELGCETVSMKTFRLFLTPNEYELRITSMCDEHQLENRLLEDN
ncbi:unnamed protein product [Toxocara canis]|uniref:Arginase n=1 Tax=Toxocara canis TaxID=6265 RepID=A0A183V0B5_TOXCA|nr:unnamed protein product [Toxocara canis]